jgi:hypothetical protein
MYQPFSFLGNLANIIDEESLTRMTIQLSGSVGYNQITRPATTYILSSSFNASGGTGPQAELLNAADPNGSQSLDVATLIISDPTLNSFPSNSISCSGVTALFLPDVYTIGSVTMVYKLLPNWYRGNPPSTQVFRNQTLFSTTTGSVTSLFYPTGIYITSASLDVTASLGIGVETPTPITNYWMSGSYYVADSNHPLQKFELINNNLISNNSSNWYSFPGDKLNGMDNYQFLTISAKTLIPSLGNPWSLFAAGTTRGYPGFDGDAPYDNSNKLMLAAFIVWDTILNDDEVFDLYSYFKRTLKYNI